MGISNNVQSRNLKLPPRCFRDTFVGLAPSADHLISKFGLLILDREVGTRGRLVLVADEVGNLLILGLFHSTLIVLRPLLEDVFLHKIDACSIEPGLVGTRSVNSAPWKRNIVEAGRHQPLSRASSFFSLSLPPPANELSLSMKPPLDFCSPSVRCSPSLLLPPEMALLMKSMA